MTPEERERYQKRRMEEILTYMRHAAEVKKKRSSLVVSDAIVSYFYVTRIKNQWCFSRPFHLQLVGIF